MLNRCAALWLRYAASSSTPLDGILQSLRVEEGVAVRATQPLAIMDNKVQEALTMVAAIRAKNDSEIKARKLSLAEMDIRLQQVTELVASQAAQDWELRQARVQRDLAEAELHAAEYQHELDKETLVAEQLRLERFTLRAPFDGRVVRIEPDAGATLRTDDPVVLLVDLSRLKAELFLPLSHFGTMKIGATYSLMAEAPVNRMLQGRLKHVEPLIDPASQTFRCVFEIPNADETLPAGFSVQLVKITDSKP